VRGLVVQSRAEGAASTARYVRRAGVPMARRRPPRRSARADRPRVRLAIPARRAARCGRMPAPIALTSTRCSSRPTSSSRNGSEARVAPPARARLTETAASSTFRRADRPRSSSAPASGSRPLGDESRPGSTTPALAAGPPAARPALGRQLLPQRGRRDLRGELIDRTASRVSRRAARRSPRKHANFIVNDRKGHGGDVRRLMDRVRVAVLESSGVELQPEIVFLGDWTGGRAEAEDRHVTATGRRSSSCSAGRPRSMTSRRIRDGDRRGARHGGVGRPARAHRPRRALVLAARRASARGQAASAYDDPAALGAEGQ